MSENRRPLTPHPDRPNVWVREQPAPAFTVGMGVQVKRGEGKRDWYGTVTDVEPSLVWVLRDGEWDPESIWSIPQPFRPEELVPVPRSGTPAAEFWTLVGTWTGIFLSVWLAVLVAHAAMQIALRTVGLQRSAVVAASLGAIVGAVTWLVGRRR